MENMHMLMSTSTTGMAMDTATATQSMDMASQTGMAGMDGMSSDDGGMSMSMADMAMVFFTSIKTPFLFPSWTPTTKGQYAGTCVFLVALAFILRVLLAVKPLLEARFWTSHSMRHADKEAADTAHQMLIDRPTRRLRAVTDDAARKWSGWSVNAAASRATFEVLIAAVGYLLMLAVMTMNVGYFLSVLGGIWLGTFLLGGLAHDNQWAHC